MEVVAANWAGPVQVQPLVDAVSVVTMFALQGFYCLSIPEIVQANCTGFAE